MARGAYMLCLIIITPFLPPLAVFLLSGCSADFVINILLTILGCLPGIIHAFYLQYVYYSNRDAVSKVPAPGVYSERIHRGGRNYGSIP